MWKLCLKHAYSGTGDIQAVNGTILLTQVVICNARGLDGSLMCGHCSSCLLCQSMWGCFLEWGLEQQQRHEQEQQKAGQQQQQEELKAGGMTEQQEQPQ